MRNSKRCTSIILIVVLLVLSVGGFSVSAEEYTAPDTFIYGDVDFDGDVTVRDATAIQKGLAGITYLTGVQKYLADPDNQGVTVSRATDIQKFVAGISNMPSNIGTAVQLITTEEFSHSVSVDDDFKDDCIIVVAKLGLNHDYSLEDFPEYEFESIGLIGEPTSEQLHFYLLYLNDKGKENVIEALKALDYRANLDLLIAQPNYLYELV